MELGDRSEVLYAGLAMVYADQPQSQEELTQALEFAAEAKKQSDNNGMVDFARGLALQRLGRYQEAIVSYQHNILINANASGAWVGISQCYRALGMMKLADEAAKTGEKVLNHRQRVGTCT
jgi:tetratricopeptide (TPR) repeat protein